MQRSKLPYFFLGLAAVLALAALVMLILRPGVEPVPLPPVVETPVLPPVPPKIDGLADPGVLVAQIATALEAGDLAKVGRLIGKDALDSQTIARLKALSTGPLRLRQPDGVREVGELELNARSRWALELEGQEPGRDSIFQAGAPSTASSPTNEYLY